MSESPTQPGTGTTSTEVLELRRIGEETASDAQAFLASVTEVAAGSSPDIAIPVLLLALSQSLLAGARLGAITDVVPSERFEPDAGPDPDVDPVRAGLANLFEGLDEYADVGDPLTSARSSAAHSPTTSPTSPPPRSRPAALPRRPKKNK